MVKIYLDVIWALNFFFDAFILYLTAIILKERVKRRKIAFGGFIGSLLIVLSITPLSAAAAHPFGKFSFSILMVLVVFGFRRLRFFVKALMTFYVTTFLLGGTLTGVHYFLQFDANLATKVAIADIRGYGDPVSWFFILLGFPLAWHFSKRNIEQFEMTKIHYESLADVEIQFMGRKLTLQGLIDSGNLLHDPISKMPVMIISISNVINEIPDEIKSIAMNPDIVWSGEGKFPKELENKMRIIPCKVVGQEHQLMIAFQPEGIKILSDGKVFAPEKGLISFTMQELSGEGRFNCIIHPGMMAGMASVNDGIKVS